MKVWRYKIRSYRLSDHNSVIEVKLPELNFILENQIHSRIIDYGLRYYNAVLFISWNILTATAR